MSRLMPWLFDRVVLLPDQREVAAQHVSGDGGARLRRRSPVLGSEPTGKLEASRISGPPPAAEAGLFIANHPVRPAPRGASAPSSSRPRIGPTHGRRRLGTAFRRIPRRTARFRAARTRLPSWCIEAPPRRTPAPCPYCRVSVSVSLLKPDPFRLPEIALSFTN